MPVILSFVAKEPYELFQPLICPFGLSIRSRMIRSGYVLLYFECFAQSFREL